MLPQVAGLQRCDALQVESPQVSPLTVKDHQRMQLQTELAACHDRLHIPCVPEDELQTGEALGAALEEATLCWFRTFYPQGPTAEEKSQLTDAWIDVLYSCPAAFDCNLDPWLERVFLLWGEHWLPDVVDTFEDGVAEYDVDEIFAEFASQLERYQQLPISKPESSLAPRLPLCRTGQIACLVILSSTRRLVAAPSKRLYEPLPNRYLG